MKTSNPKTIYVDFTHPSSRKFNIEIIRLFYMGACYISLTAALLLLEPFGFFSNSTQDVALIILSLCLPFILGFLYLTSAKLKLVEYLAPKPNKFGLFRLSKQVDLSDNAMNVCGYSLAAAFLCLVLAITVDVNQFKAAFYIFLICPLTGLYAKILLNLPLWKK